MDDRFLIDFYRFLDVIEYNSSIDFQNALKRLECPNFADFDDLRYLSDKFIEYKTVKKVINDISRFVRLYR